MVYLYLDATGLWRDSDLILKVRLPKTHHLFKVTLTHVTSDSRIQCCFECAYLDECNSISYINGQCTMYTTYPSADTSFFSLLIYPVWCDVRSGFIYIREINLCFQVIPSPLRCSGGKKTYVLHTFASFVEINSEERNTFITNVLQHDAIINGTFISGKLESGKWIGMDFAVDYWAYGQPNNWNTPRVCIGPKRATRILLARLRKPLDIRSYLWTKIIFSSVRLNIFYSLFLPYKLDNYVIST